METKTPFNFDKLRLLRESLGLLQAEVADRLGVTQAALSKLESGELIPSDVLLNRIASKFGYPVKYFLEESPFVPSGLVFHRKRASLPAKFRSKLEAEAKLRALDALKMLNYTKCYCGFATDLIDRGGSEPEDCARLLRKHWNVEAACPIDNLVKLCERNGVLILAFDFGTDKIDGFFLYLSEASITVLVVNDSPAFAPDRRRFSLAHELGHAVLHRNEFPSKVAEEEANRFAAEFLAPEAGIACDIRRILNIQKTITLRELFALKRQWKISMAAVLYRAKSLNLISESDYRRLCVYMSSQGYRKQEPPADIESEQPETLKDLFEDCSENVDGAMQEYLGLSDDAFQRRYRSFLTKGENVSP